MTVSRETVNDRRSHSSGCGRVRDASIDGRSRRGDASRRRVIETVLSFVAEKNFRPTLREIAARAAMPSTSILRLYGSLELLNRVVAREHVADIAKAAGAFFTIHPDDHAHFAWLIMVGRPRDLS